MNFNGASGRLDRRPAPARHLGLVGPWIEFAGIHEARAFGQQRSPVVAPASHQEGEEEHAAARREEPRGDPAGHRAPAQARIAEATAAAVGPAAAREAIGTRR
jgi:hypothetical protein